LFLYFLEYGNERPLIPAVLRHYFCEFGLHNTSLKLKTIAASLSKNSQECQLTVKK
jgi:hypothetical protein